MAINYYPDHVQKRRHHVVDVLSGKRVSRTVNGSKDLAGGALAFVLAPVLPEWKVELTSLNFSNATSRNYSINILTGRGIITGLNDSLWIDMNSSGWAQRIVLAPGFYDGTSLSAEVKAALEANSVFNELGLTFTVAYGASTGLFTITPSSGTMQFFNTYTPQNLRRNSTAGVVLGLTADQTGSSIISDTAVPSLGKKMLVMGKTGSTDTNVVSTNTMAMSEDEALSIDASSAAVVIDYLINYSTTEE